MAIGVYERRPFAERFWEKVEKTSGCWMWKGTLYVRGDALHPEPAQ